MAGVNLSLGNQEASEGASSSQEQESDCREQRDSQQLEVKKTSATKEGENTPEQLRSEAKETIEESRIVKCPNFANPGEKDIVASDCRRDLSHAKLSEANLRKANLNGVILTGADLRQAKLQGATLFGTDLSNADLSNANLTGALYNDQTQFPQDFDPESAKACRIAPKADLRQCKNNIEGLEDLNLRQVNLSKADLRGVDLTKADLTDADLSEALFTDRNLLPKSVSDEMRHKMYEIAPRGELIRVDLRELNLEEADLTEAILTRADLRGTNLSNVILTGTNLEGALYDSRTQFPEDFSKKGKGMYEIVAYSKELTGADLSDVILQLVDLRGVDFKDVDLKGTKLIGADLRSADLSKAKNFDDESTSFDKAIYDDKTKFPDGFNRKGLFKIAPGNNEDKGKGLTQAQLDSRDLKKADLSEADLTGASLRDSILIEANLSRATLVEASLERANLSDADLTCADLEGADLRGIRNWTKGQIEAAKNFRKAYYDEDTRKKLNIQRPDQESDDTDTSPEFENKNACKGESNN
ncbi:MAG: pentapeptide repeat-containing protein [Microcoleaceae cyanobacterium]